MRMSKRNLAVTAVTFAAAGGVSAFAFVTTTADGQGSTKTDATKTLTIGVNQPANLGIGDKGDVTFSVTNPNHGTVRIKNIALNVVAPTSCPAGSFTVDDGTHNAGTITYSLPASGVPVAPGGPTTVGTVILHFNDLPDTNQDACTNGEAIVVAHAS